MGQEFCFTSFSKKMRYPVQNTEYLIFYGKAQNLKFMKSFENALVHFL